MLKKDILKYMPEIIGQGLRLLVAVIIIACAWWVIRYLFQILGVETNMLLGMAFFAVLLGIFSYGFRVE